MTPFPSEVIALIIAVAGLFVAGFVKGTTGLGYASCALPFLTVVVGFQPAVVVSLGPTIVTCVAVSRAAGHAEEIVRRFWPLLLATVPGAGCGVVLLQWLDKSIATSCLGGVMVIYAVFSLTRPAIKLTPRMAASLEVPVGFANGMVAGLTGSQVMPLLPYALALDLDSDRTIQLINIVVMGGAVAVAIGLLLVGNVTIPLAAASVGSVVPALLGVRLGNAVRVVLPISVFRAVVLTILGLMGAVLIFHG